MLAVKLRFVGVKQVHTRSDEAVAATSSDWVRLQTVKLLQSRSVVTVGAWLWNCNEVQTDVLLQIRSLVPVGRRASNSTAKLHCEKARQTEFLNTWHSAIKNCPAWQVAQGLQVPSESDEQLRLEKETPAKHCVQFAHRRSEVAVEATAVYCDKLQLVNFTQTRSLVRVGAVRSNSCCEQAVRGVQT